MGKDYKIFVYITERRRTEKNREDNTQR